MKPLLLGLGHKARQGKSLFGEAVLAWCKTRGIKASGYSFGKAVLDYCKVEGLISEHSSREGLLPEELKILQDVGLEKRQENKSFWIWRLQERMMKDVGAGTRVLVIDNIRMKNEAEWLSGLSTFRGVGVEIQRFDALGGRFISPDRDPRHRTEIDLDDVKWWDFLVRNGKGLSWVSLQAEALMQHLVLTG